MLHMGQTELFHQNHPNAGRNLKQLKQTKANFKLKDSSIVSPLRANVENAVAYKGHLCWIYFISGMFWGIFHNLSAFKVIHSHNLRPQFAKIL